MTSENHDRLGSQAASASELDSNIEKHDDASEINQEDNTADKSNLELTKTTSTDAPVYITGVKLQLVFLALALVAFLMLLDISIVATVSQTCPKSTTPQRLPSALPRHFSRRPSQDP